MITCNYDESISHLHFLFCFQAKGQFKKQSVANNVEVRIPVPSDADSPKFKTSTGHAKYVPEKNLVVWTIKSFPVSITAGRCYCKQRPQWSSLVSSPSSYFMAFFGWPGMIGMTESMCVFSSFRCSRGGRSSSCVLTLGSPAWRMLRWRENHPSQSSLRSHTSPCQEYRYFKCVRARVCLTAIKIILYILPSGM